MYVRVCMFICYQGETDEGEYANRLDNKVMFLQNRIYFVIVKSFFFQMSLRCLGNRNGFHYQGASFCYPLPFATSRSCKRRSQDGGRAGVAV